MRHYGTFLSLVLDLHNAQEPRGTCVYLVPVKHASVSEAGFTALNNKHYSLEYLEQSSIAHTISSCVSKEWAPLSRGRMLSVLETF